MNPRDIFDLAPSWISGKHSVVLVDPCLERSLWYGNQPVIAILSCILREGGINKRNCRFSEGKYLPAIREHSRRDGATMSL